MSSSHTTRSPRETPEQAPAQTSSRTSGETSQEPEGAEAPVADDAPSYPVLDAQLAAELPTFELFFKTFGFKRMHGRVWGLLVLTENPLSSKEIASELGISAGATSTTLNELAEWGAVRSTFDSSRRCHLHSPVGNALSIVATVFRRREQVVFQQFRQAAIRSLAVITEKKGERDPRVLTLRSIITTCDIGEALMQLVFSAVQNAMSDSESVLSRAIQAAFKVGIGAPTRWLLGDSLLAAGNASSLAHAPRLQPEAEPKSESDDAEPRT
ncbi:MAG: MarR family transcriptional regulator [Planctomycetota bacterium]